MVHGLGGVPHGSAACHHHQLGLTCVVADLTLADLHAGYNTAAGGVAYVGVWAQYQNFYAVRMVPDSHCDPGSSDDSTSA